MRPDRDVINSRLAFFTEDDVKKALADKLHYRSYVETTRRLLIEASGLILKTARPSQIFMPLAGYPEAHGLSWSVAPTLTGDLSESDTGLRLILHLCPSGAGPRVVTVGSFVVRIGGDGVSIRVDGAPDRQWTTTDGWLELNVLRNDAQEAAYFGDELVAMRHRSPGSLALDTPCERDRFAQIEIIGQNPFLYCAKDDPRSVPLGPTPYRYRWETDLHRVYQLAVRAQLAAELAELSDDADEFRTLIRGFADARFRALEHWSAWRPAGADRPDDGQWDLNNWANGLAGGVYAICASLLDKTAESSVRTLFRRRSTAWLLSERFPENRHWLRRSTNHGLVIYASHLTACHFMGLSDTSEALDLFHKKRRVLRIVFADGSYREGLAYFRFAMEHVWLAEWLRWRRSGTPWDEFCGAELGYLRHVPSFLSLTTSSKSAPWGNFGDTHLRHWNRNAALCLTVAAAGAPAGGHHLPVALRQTETMFPLCRAAPAPEPEPEQRSAVLREFADGGLAGVEFFRDGLKVGGLFVIGSVHQITHNSVHDCGGFAFEADGVPVVLLRQSLGQAGSNGVCAVVNGAPRLPVVRRSYDGELKAESISENIHLIRTSVLFPRDLHKTLGVIRVTRVFLAVGGDQPVVIVLTFAKMRPWAAAGLCLNLGAEGAYGVETAHVGDVGGPLSALTLDGGALCLTTEAGLERHLFVTTIAPAGTARTPDWTDGAMSWRCPDGCVKLSFSNDYRGVTAELVRD